jgi:3-oxoacyl-[acyl-carrier-protein] synthase-3
LPRSWNPIDAHTAASSHRQRFSVEEIRLFIHASGEYVPQRAVDNEYFSQLTGKPVHWFEALTGIRERRRAAEGENTNTMAIESVRNLLSNAPDALAGVDLIVGASYTPWDTIGTIAHVLQREFSIHRARALYVSSACSSFIDALDLTAAYFQAGRASKALIVAAEHNSLYSKDEDAKSGHLWGDGAAAVVIGKECKGQAMEIVDVSAVGLADLGHGPEAIQMAPCAGGLVMTYGKDIFMHACREMVAATRRMIEHNNVSLDDLALMIPHQANQRIINCVTEHLHLPADRAAMTIDTLGNTGCASVAITYHRHWQRIQAQRYAVLVTFGGGYSAGAALLRRSTPS